MNLVPGDKFKDCYGCKFTVTHSTEEGLCILWQDGLLEIWDKRKFISDLSKNRFYKDQTRSWEDLHQLFKSTQDESHSIEDFVIWLKKKYKVPDSIY